MKINYRKSLEQVARQMILIHDADALITSILRTIVSCMDVKHAGLLIYDKQRNEYVVRISRGNKGFKIPSGFVKVRPNNPLISYFKKKKLPGKNNVIVLNRLLRLQKTKSYKDNRPIKRFVDDLITNLSLYQAQVCIPGFFRNELIGVLFLGEKDDQSQVKKEEINFLLALMSDIVMALENAWLFEDLNRQIDINKRLFLQTVSALASSIEAKDPYTKGHTERVVQHSLAIAHQLRKDKRIDNWTEFKENLKIAALLHDIGKIGIPEEILNKREQLTEEEREVIKRHPGIGARILENIEELGSALLGVKYHHERYDGSGYPQQLKGKEIPLIAAVIAVADAFDAMTIDRPYCKSLPFQDAVREIKRCRGKHFDPAVVDAFLRVYAGK